MFKLRTSTIALFDSVESFIANALKRNQHLVYVPGLSESDIIEAIPDGLVIDQVNFLLNEIELVTSFMFTYHSCRELEFETINRFNLSSKSWETSVFYPKKYENFHGCVLYIADQDFCNDEWKIIEEIFQEKPNSTDLEYTTCDLTHQHFFIHQTYQLFYVTVSYPHRFSYGTFAIAPGQPYTDFERMFMMFDIRIVRHALEGDGQHNKLFFIKKNLTRNAIESVTYYQNVA